MVQKCFTGDQREHQPQELSFYSIMGEAMQGNSTSGKEKISSEEELQPSVRPQGYQALGTRELPDGSGVIMRPLSEMTPRSQKKFFKSRSEFPAIPLKSGSKICNK